MIVGTYQMIEYLQKVAPQYPDKKFFLYDASVDYAAKTVRPISAPTSTRSCTNRTKAPTWRASMPRR